MGDIDKGKELDCLNPIPLLWLSQTRTSANEERRNESNEKPHSYARSPQKVHRPALPALIFRQSQPKSQENGLKFQKYRQ